MLFERLKEIIYVKVVQDSVNVKSLPFFSHPITYAFLFPFLSPFTYRYYHFPNNNFTYKQNREMKIFDIEKCLPKHGILKENLLI